MKYGAFWLILFAGFISSNSRADLRRDFNKIQCDQVISTPYYQICYDYKAKGAKAVFYVLEGDLMDRVNIKKRPGFYAEKALPDSQRTYSADYTRNPYHADRGHLAPDAAFDWSKDSLHAVYSMANIIPQYYMINRRSWLSAERYARQQAITHQSVQILNLVNYGDYGQRFPKSGIAVPYSYTKIIEVGSDKSCFLYINDEAHYKVNRHLEDHRITCP